MHRRRELFTSGLGRLFRGQRELNPVETAVIETRVGQAVIEEAAFVNNLDAEVSQIKINHSTSGQQNMQTPKLNSLKGAFESFTKRVEAAAGTLLNQMDETGSSAEQAVTKFGGVVDSIHATVKDIEDTANQMTNGGPPLAGA